MIKVTQYTTYVVIKPSNCSSFQQARRLRHDLRMGKEKEVRGISLSQKHEGTFVALQL